jgi:hypothetical protein
MKTNLYARVTPVDTISMNARTWPEGDGRRPVVRYHVHVGTTSILHRNLCDLARELQRAIERAGYVFEPKVASQLLTRRLVMSAYVDSHDEGAAMAIARSVLLSHLYEHGPEFRRVGIHHTDATPVA